MSWVALLTAIAFDVAGTYALAASHGFRHLGPTVLAVGGFLATIYFFGLALAHLGPSISYAVFGAVGTASVAVIGMTWAGEPANWAKLVALALIIVGVLLLPVAEHH